MWQIRTFSIGLLVILAVGMSTLAESKDSTEALTQQGVLPRLALPMFPLDLIPSSTCGYKVDYVDVELYKGDQGVSTDYVKANEPSTVQLQWLSASEIRAKLPGSSVGNVGGRRWCSGTLIAGNRVLTAGHCVAALADPGGWTTPFAATSDGKLQASSATLATLMKVNFNYQLDKSTNQSRIGRSFPVTKLLENGSEAGLDYAILEVGPDAEGILPDKVFAVAEVLTREPRPGEKIALIQHPNGDPKKVTAGKVKSVVSSRIFYNDVDSDHGSSGSGIRDSSGKVIGVHTNGGCDNPGGSNAGFTTAAIASVSKIL